MVTEEFCGVNFLDIIAVGLYNMAVDLTLSSATYDMEVEQYLWASVFVFEFCVA